MKNKRKLRVYQKGTASVWVVDGTKSYPELKCPYKDANCSTQCAHFILKKWITGTPIYCGNVNIGVLA